MLVWLRKLFGHIPPSVIKRECDPPAEIHVRMNDTLDGSVHEAPQTLGAPLTCFEGHVIAHEPTQRSHADGKRE
jgi:hypothetical protein